MTPFIIYMFQNLLLTLSQKLEEYIGGKLIILFKITYYINYLYLTGVCVLKVNLLFHPQATPLLLTVPFLMVLL